MSNHKDQSSNWREYSDFTFESSSLSSSDLREENQKSSQENEIPLSYYPEEEVDLTPYLDMSSDYAFEAVDFDTKFRSMQTVENSQNFLSLQTSTGIRSSKYQSNEPLESMGSSIEPYFEIKQSIKPSIEVIIEPSSINVPEKPFYLGPSHIQLSLSLTTLFTRVQEKLNSILEVAYMFHEKSCRVSLSFPSLFKSKTDSN
jgi:hypothetical protein